MERKARRHLHLVAHPRRCVHGALSFSRNDPIVVGGWDEIGQHERHDRDDKGADFALCQLLYSNRIVQFLHEMSKQTDRRPEILLSFGFVPKAETRVGLIRWLIKDENPLVEQEIQYVAELAGKPLTQKKAELVDLYKRITGELQNLGFPLGIHLECPYGFTNPAFEVFQALLHTWSPK